MYETKRASKSEFQLTPEELDVRQALRGYTVSDDPTLDFIPTKVLYALYRGWYVQQGAESDAPDVLTPIQFGAALARVFEALEDRDRRVRRMYGGKQLWGYLGVTGPKSIVSRDWKGRPKKCGTAISIRL